MAKNADISSSSQAGEFFDRFAPVFDSFYDGTRTRFIRWFDRHFRADIFIRFERTFETLGSLDGKTVLDIGCGSGRYALEALRHGAKHVYALDAAPGMLALLRDLLETNHFAGRYSPIEAVFPAKDLTPCDCAIIIGVMDYVADSVAFMQALRPLVKDCAALSFPSRHWLRTPLRLLRYRIRKCPVFFYRESEIREIAMTAGFRQVSIYKIPGAGLDYHVCVKP